MPTSFLELLSPFSLTYTNRNCFSAHGAKETVLVGSFFVSVTQLQSLELSLDLHMVHVCCCTLEMTQLGNQEKHATLNSGYLDSVLLASFPRLAVRKS